jgi:hypothetical protein
VGRGRRPTAVRRETKEGPFEAARRGLKLKGRRFAAAEPNGQRPETPAGSVSRESRSSLTRQQGRGAGLQQQIEKRTTKSSGDKVEANRGASRDEGRQRPQQVREGVLYEQVPKVLREQRQVRDRKVLVTIDLLARHQVRHLAVAEALGPGTVPQGLPPVHILDQRAEGELSEGRGSEIRRAGEEREGGTRRTKRTSAWLIVDWRSIVPLSSLQYLSSSSNCAKCDRREGRGGGVR